MTSDDSTKDSFLAAVRQFAVTARIFCHIIDERDTGDAIELCDKLNELLPSLYLDARHMVTLAPDDFLEEPATEVVDEELFEPAAIEERNAEADEEDDEPDPLVDALSELMADDDSYFVGINYGSDDEPNTDVVQKSLSASLAQIYEEFEGEFGFLENGGADGVEDAARGWIYGFYASWGEELPYLLAKTHAVVFETLTDDEEEEEEPQA